jgi:YVTN family beta-propeller protein
LTVLSYTTDTAVRHFELSDTPLGIVLAPDGGRGAVSHFGADRIGLVDLDSGEIEKTIRVGPRPSLFASSSDGKRAFVSCEGDDRVYEVSLAPFETVGWFETGGRPFPPSLSPDDRWLFVPGYDSSDVTVIDLLMRRVDDTIKVGEHPSGGSIMPSGEHYGVVNRGSNRIDFINVVTHAIDGSLSEGLGEEPFSLVLSPNGRLGFINNTRSASVSVLDVEKRLVIARVDVGRQPIVMAVHPWGRKLYVSCEGSHELVIVSIPDEWARKKD